MRNNVGTEIYNSHLCKVIRHPGIAEYPESSAFICIHNFFDSVNIPEQKFQEIVAAWIKVRYKEGRPVDFHYLSGGVKE